ncbi:MAG: phosphoribosylanthranilate isomerase [Bacteroidota bacterium]
MSRPKLKVCGMKYPDNIAELLTLSPDYMGMIFYTKSSRNVGPELDAKAIQMIETVKKIGVFVNEEEDIMLAKAKQYGLDYLQLHGRESPELCKSLKNKGIGIIKVFSVGNGFDFKQLKAYEAFVDFFLFDTKGKHPGGNGVVFNWDILNDYPSEVPFFLSGGIGLENATDIPNHPKLFALDVNSKFELSPGLKNISELKKLNKILSAQ